MPLTVEETKFNKISKRQTTFANFCRKGTHKVNWKNFHAYGQFACHVCNSHDSLMDNSHKHRAPGTCQASHKLQDNLFFFDNPQMKKHIDQFSLICAIAAQLGFFHPLH